MADTKISALTAAPYLDGSEELPLAQAGANEKATISQAMGGAFVVLQSDYTLTSTTASQQLFNASTNGALTLTTGLYRFEAMLYITSMSATSGNGAFSVRGAGTSTIALTRALFCTIGFDTASPGTFAAQNGAFLQGAVATTTNTATAATGTSLAVHYTGQFDVTASGTIIPSIALVTAAAAVVKAGSYFRCYRVGPTATATLGNWS